MATAARPIPAQSHPSSPAPGGIATLDALNPLQQIILKRLVAVGSNGMLKQHLYQRLPPGNTAVRIKALNTLEALGLVRKGTTSRHTSRWATLWTITDAGKDRVRQLAAI